MHLRFLAISLTTAVLIFAVFNNGFAANMPTLGTTMSIDGQDHSVFIEQDSNERVSSFNKDIASHGQSGSISSCSLLIDLPAGVARGDHSYGGYCVLSDSKKGTQNWVKVCNDDMVGHFALVAVTHGESSEVDLAQFVAAHCVGG